MEEASSISSLISRLLVVVGLLLLVPPVVVSRLRSTHLLDLDATKVEFFSPTPIHARTIVHKIAYPTLYAAILTAS